MGGARDVARAAGAGAIALAPPAWPRPAPPHDGPCPDSRWSTRSRPRAPHRADATARAGSARPAAPDRRRPDSGLRPEPSAPHHETAPRNPSPTPVPTTPFIALVAKDDRRAYWNRSRLPRVCRRLVAKRRIAAAPRLYPGRPASHSVGQARTIVRASSASRRMSHQQAPMATRRPTSRTRFGVSWTDDYAWLRDPAYPEVVDPEIRCLSGGRERLVRALHGAAPAADRKPARGAEGAHQGRRQLGSGARGRDSSITGGSLPARSTATWFRRRLDGGEPVVILDEARLRRARAISACARSRSARTVGCWPTRPTRTARSAIRLHLRDLETGSELADLVANTSGAVEWAEDGRTLLYVELNDQPAAVPRTRAPTGRGPGRRRRALRGGRPGVLRLDRKTRSRALLADRQRHPRNARDLAA